MPEEAFMIDVGGGGGGVLARTIDVDGSGPIHHNVVFAMLYS